MGLSAPGALWALTTLFLLLLFSLWRSRPRRVLVACATLWKRIPERMPPMRAARRPRISAALIVQALAVSALVSALARPFLKGKDPVARRFAVVLDTSARMEARRSDGRSRFQAAREQAEEALRGRSPRDEARVYWIDDAPRRWEGSARDLPDHLRSLRPVHHSTDLGGLFPSIVEEEIWWLSDRPAPRAGCVQFLAGEEAENAGIVHVAFEDDELFVRLARYGPAREIQIRIRLDDREIAAERVVIPSGGRTWWRRIEAGDALRLTVEIDGRDPFSLDDRVTLTRLDVTDGVRIEGVEHPLLERALQAVPGVRLGEGRTLVLHRTLAGTGEPVVYVDPPGSPPGFSLGERFRPGIWSTADHPLVRHVHPEELSAEFVREVRGGTPILFADGRPVAAILGRTIVLAMELDPSGWSATPSFPIFWTNVVRFARTGESWRAVRAGDVIPLPQETSVVRAEFPLARFSFQPSSGEFRSHSVGSFVAQGPNRRVRLDANLLDESQSDTRGSESRGGGGSTTSLECAKIPLDAPWASIALALMIVSWWLDRRR